MSQGIVRNHSSISWQLAEELGVMKRKWKRALLNPTVTLGGLCACPRTAPSEEQDQSLRTVEEIDFAKIVQPVNKHR